MGAEIEDSELRKLAYDFGQAATVAPEESRKAVARGSLNIKNDARRRREGSRYFPKLLYSITYDTGVTPTGAWGEVGPDPAKPQGNLGHIPEYGALRTPAEPYMAPAGDAEEPRFAKAMEDLAARVIEP